MNIGQVAKRTNLSAKAIRYYEQIDLLNNIPRTDAGYRAYQEQHLRTLKFIQHCRSLGFEYSDIQDLLRLWQSQDRQSMDVKTLAQQHIVSLNQKVQELQRMIAILQQSVDECAGNSEAECSILNQLEQFDTQHTTCCAHKTLDTE